MFSDVLVKALGWRGALLHGDSTAFDRWLWLRKRLRAGALRTLDAGCGSGTFTLYAAELGNDSLGLSFLHPEKAERRAQICGLNNAHFRFFDLRKLHELVGTIEPFDQIVCFECLEHILDDKYVVRNMASLLKPGGRMLITVPYKHYRHLFGDALSEVEDGGHVRWGYTHDELRSMVEANGLQIVEEDYVSGFVSQSLANAQRMTARLPVVGELGAWALTLPFRWLIATDRMLTEAIKYPYLSVAIVAVKGEAAAAGQG